MPILAIISAGIALVLLGWFASFFFYSANPEKLHASNPASNMFLGLAAEELVPLRDNWPAEACLAQKAKLSWAWNVHPDASSTPRYVVIGCEYVEHSGLPTPTPAVPLSQLDCEAGKQAQVRARNSGAPTNALDLAATLSLPDGDPRKLTLLEMLNRTPDLPQSMTSIQIKTYREGFGYVWSPEEKLWCVLRK
jgi:hypothetical protein